jgi:hypothetical protein
MSRLVIHDVYVRSVLKYVILPHSGSSLLGKRVELVYPSPPF